MKKFMAAVLFIVSVPALATDYYCGSKVTLSGTLTTRVGMGLDETKTNDVPVRYPALSLDEPINMVEKNRNPDDLTECSAEKFNVSDVQLVLDDFALHKRNIGKRAKVVCRMIYPPMTAHHLSDIICEVEKIRITK